jgi:activator of HSP90 ATPase
MYPKGLHFVWMDHGAGSSLESRTFEDMQMTCIVHLCVVSHFHAAQEKDGKCKQNLKLNSWPADMRRPTQAQRVSFHLCTFVYSI